MFPWRLSMGRIGQRREQIKRGVRRAYLGKYLYLHWLFLCKWLAG